MLDQKIIDIIGCRSCGGEFGLELEVEGTNLPLLGLNPYWQLHQDGSLRGEAAEYVLTQPLSFNETKTALRHLDRCFQKFGSTFNLSSRTSVHVHLNCQRALLQEVYSLIALEFIFDNLLVEYSGPDRIGNLFCLRAQDAEYLPLQVALNLKKQHYLGFLNDNIRYASMNLLALQTYGSIEFRSFRGSVNQEEIVRWIEIISAIKSASKRYNDPRAIVKDLYDNGPLAFMRSIFSEEIVEVFTSFRNWRSSVEKGSHYAFEIAYATNDWKDKEAVHKAYKDRKKMRPGECEDPANDPRFEGMEPEAIDRFLYLERDYGEIIRIGTRQHREYVDSSIRFVEQQRQTAERRLQEQQQRQQVQNAQNAMNEAVRRTNEDHIRRNFLYQGNEYHTEWRDERVCVNPGFFDDQPNPVPEPVQPEIRPVRNMYRWANMPQVAPAPQEFRINYNNLYGQPMEVNLLEDLLADNEPETEEEETL